MKIGFANIYSFRPHVEHLYFLSLLLENNGHEVCYLTCDADLSNCYPRMLKGTGKIKECSKCILGGIRSYSDKNISSLSAQYRNECLTTNVKNILDELALSSSCTLTRTETDFELNNAEVVFFQKKLQQPIRKTYQASLNWIRDNELEAVICFNGRMDMTRALTYACETMKVPYITHERTWFGDGLLLTPNANCLSLKSVGEMVSDFDNKPLTLEQARLAGKLIAERFLQKNVLEWRLYNKDPESITWPANSTEKKVLVLPSSRNEYTGHDDWISDWSDNTKALDDLFEVFSIRPEDVVVRFHPNWSENIGKISGDRATNLYTKWAKRKNIFFISSEDKANTYDLIQQADIVVLNGGSSAVEAGACGKQVICLGPANYDQSGFLRVFNNKKDMFRSNALINLEPEIIIRKTLRFVYLSAKRLPQYVDYVKALETIKYKYFDGGDPQRLIDIIVSGKVTPDDGTYAKNKNDEDLVVDLLKDRDWQSLIDCQLSKDLKTPLLRVKRRFGFRWIDDFRKKLALGDR